MGIIVLHHSMMGGTPSPGSTTLMPSATWVGGFSGGHKHGAF